MRIPVVGPDGYNTVAVVRETFTFTAGTFNDSDGKIHRYTWPIATNFVLIGYDPRATVWQHSTTAALRMLASTDSSAGTFDDTATVWTAVDAINRAYFDEHGTWTLDVDLAGMSDDPDTIAAANIMISSWVLCYEPPVDPRRPGFGGKISDVPRRPFQLGPNPGAPPRRPRTSATRWSVAAKG